MANMTLMHQNTIAGRSQGALQSALTAIAHREEFTRKYLKALDERQRRETDREVTNNVMKPFYIG